jgi:hypothetical protein
MIDRGNLFVFRRMPVARIGHDPSAFHICAIRIKNRLDKKLWLPEKSVVAEYVETTAIGLTTPRRNCRRASYVC